jgi:hypothetical protein
MRRLPTGDERARTFCWVERGLQPQDAIIEYWPAWAGMVAMRPAEVNYFAGGPSSCTWYVPGTGEY